MIFFYEKHGPINIHLYYTWFWIIYNSIETGYDGIGTGCSCIDTRHGAIIVTFNCRNSGHVGIEMNYNDTTYNVCLFCCVFFYYIIFYIYIIY